MLSNRTLLLQFMIVIVVVVAGLGDPPSCTPNRLVLLSHCSFRHSSPVSFTNQTTNDKRTLSMIVPYSFNRNDEDDLLVTIITHNKSLIQLNLNFIQCESKSSLLNWTSLESSSALHGEFLRTSLIHRNSMYLPSGKVYLKNLSTVDCKTNTIYRTDRDQLFQLDLRVESTLDDYCSADTACYPEETYQCDQNQQRCICRQPFQPYLIKERYSICVQAVDTMEQCLTSSQRCLPWCQQNSSSSMCLCPKEFAVKRLAYDHRGKNRRRIGFSRYCDCLYSISLL
jgi:hypothetical protein